MTEAEAHAGAARCLDCAVCCECGECVAACPADCIDLHARETELEVDVGAVVVSTGFKLFTADAKPEYGFGRFKNVITGMQMDRLLAPTRPFNTILRPGDGKVPERIAYVLCTGSRDETVGNPLCSRFCCMYSIKQNQLIMGALPLADVTVHYMDIRAPGKRYDEFYEQARAMGANYVKGRVAKITEQPDGDLVLHYEDIENGGAVDPGRVRPGRAGGRRTAQQRRPGALPGGRAVARRVALRRGAQRGPRSRAHEHPGRVRRGCRIRGQGHRGFDPPCGSGGGAGRRAPGEGEGAGMNETTHGRGHHPAARASRAPAVRTARTRQRAAEGGRRIGVYVCHCGGNISDYVDVDKVIASIADEGDVVVSRTAMFTCSDATQQEMIADIEGQQLDGLVVASCSPKLHTYTFRGVASRAGLNPYEYTQVEHPGAVLLGPYRR